MNIVVTSIIEPVCCSRLPGKEGLGAEKFAGRLTECRIKLLGDKTTNDGLLCSVPGVGKLTTMKTVPLPLQ